jgi:septal ring factor EnvC (AmiA/AmiB activator)
VRARKYVHVIVLVLVLVLVRGAAFADEEQSSAAPATASSNGSLDDQLTAQRESIDRALTTVNIKLTTADQARVSRLRAAYRALAPAPDAMTTARRRAGARLLLDRDRSERTLLADEASRLRGARDRTIAADAKLPSLTAPSGLAWPATGKVARAFGEFVHEHSKATLSRRGIDLEVDEHAPAIAPAAGTVRYAGPMRGLEHGVIIDHGDYLTVVAKLADTSLPVGTHLERGDRLGLAARHRVYFEVRVKVGPGGLPIDPETVVEHPHAHKR